MKNRGFTLIEVLVALFILTGGILVLANAWSGNFMRMRKSAMFNDVATLLERKMVETEAKYKSKQLAEIPDAEVTTVFRPEEGYGGPLHEVLHVWLEVRDTADALAFTAICVKWLKGRWHRDREKNPPPRRPRPRGLHIYEEERLIRVVKIDLPAGEAVDEEPDPGAELPHRRPNPAECEDGTA